MDQIEGKGEKNYQKLSLHRQFINASFIFLKKLLRNVTFKQQSGETLGLRLRIISLTLYQKFTLYYLIVKGLGTWLFERSSQKVYLWHNSKQIKFLTNVISEAINFLIFKMFKHCCINKVFDNPICIWKLT